MQNAALTIAPGGDAFLVDASYAGGSMDVEGTLTLQNAALSGGMVANSGSIAASANSQLQFGDGGGLTNSGMIVASGSYNSSLPKVAAWPMLARSRCRTTHGCN